MGETATRILLGFVIAGAVVLVAGVVLLIWLLATGAQGRRAPATDEPPVVRLAPGQRILSLSRGPDDLAILLEDEAGRQVLRLLDPDSGATLHDLPVTTAP
ncbi:hypothetical protein [Geminicoccus flavidas]|uniref:hypothetical protein n=1 Tax=Geminicoccus flavidas TaxID=2506407 RepID=UPI00135A038A|nr:hypothetical protein [Geminicoccus flavidas]